MALTIRSKVDGELTRRVGKWFTVREIQDKLRINPATLKPLIMKYARENLLRRRHVKGTARSVQFTPAAGSANGFKRLMSDSMPYRNLLAKKNGTTRKASASKKRSSKKSTKRSKR